MPIPGPAAIVTVRMIGSLMYRGGEEKSNRKVLGFDLTLEKNAAVLRTMKSQKHLELVYKNMYNKSVERRTISSEKAQNYQVKEKME